MAERRIITIPFGEGLQRSDGIMIVRPTTFSDLRNVYQFEGKAQVRRGMIETERLIDNLSVDLDRTLALSPLRAENAALGVGQDTANNNIWVNRLTVAGTNAVNVGLFGTLGAGITWNPPIILLADSDNKCFIAHDEPNVNARLVTKYYDLAAFPPLVTLTADLDGNGPAPVFFRGVVRHLSYIFGWGYGSALDPGRIDVVRVSTGGNPTIFRDDAFFEVGQRGEPVLVCRPAGNFLMVFKETETYQIFGYSPDTFGIRPSDTLFGCVSSRLAVSIAGSVFFWSVQGPRVTTGGESVDIAVPLDLDGPDPATLVAESDVQDAFAEYDPATRVISFVWGRRVYALSIRDPSKPRWSYYELAERAQCGAQFFATQSTQGGGGQPANGPDFDVVAFTDITSTTAVANWDNVGATGGEQIEAWARVAAPAGPWSQVGEFAYNGLLNQAGQITGLTPGTSYDVALRYRRGGLYNPGAVSPDPATWPAVAQATLASTVAVPVATLRGENNGLWECFGPGLAPLEERITINWTNPPGAETLQVEVWRRVRQEGDFAVQNVTGFGMGPPDSVAPAPPAFALLTTVPAGSTAFTDLALTRQRWHDYKLQYAGSVGAFSAVIECWAGPDAQLTGSFVVLSSDPLLGAASFGWANATTPAGRTACPGPAAPPANHFTFVFVNDMDANPASNAWFAVDQAAPFATVMNVDFTGVFPDNTDIRVDALYIVFCFGQNRPSYWHRNYQTTIVGTD
jgi:hypothetical protein